MEVRMTTGRSVKALSTIFRLGCNPQSSDALSLVQSADHTAVLFEDIVIGTIPPGHPISKMKVKPPVASYEVHGNPERPDRPYLVLSVNRVAKRGRK